MRGRPKKSNSKVYGFKFRCTEKENEMLNYIVTKTGSNKSKVLRDALEILYNIERFKE